ncbi:MAG: hypothetical protein ED557_04110 [Balneola sp.]|nr:MAG: hypothetical protein ED557_04110 [Balneola sp.]
MSDIAFVLFLVGITWLILINLILTISMRKNNDSEKPKDFLGSIKFAKENNKTLYTLFLIGLIIFFSGFVILFLNPLTA